MIRSVQKLISCENDVQERAVATGVSPASYPSLPTCCSIRPRTECRWIAA